MSMFCENALLFVYMWWKIENENATLQRMTFISFQPIKTSKFNCHRRLIPVFWEREVNFAFAKKTTSNQIFNSFKMKKVSNIQKINKRDWHYANHLDSLLKSKEAKCVEIDMPRFDTSMMKYISFTYHVKIQFAFHFHTTFITISCYNIQNGCSFSIFFCYVWVLCV